MSNDKVTTWHPADIFSDHPNEHIGFALVILNQPLELRGTFYSKIWQNCSFKIGADGGANRVQELTNTQNQTLPLDLIIGDLDSLSSKCRTFWEDKGVEIIKDGDQYSTDFTKAVRHLWPSFPSPSSTNNIVVLGGLGGRVDQGISVLHHLYMFQKTYEHGKMFLLSGEGITFVLKSGKHRIKAKESYEGVKLGVNVGIIPLKEPSRITTKGLEWDVEGWETEFGGMISTSNHVMEEMVEVETTKDVLFTIDFVVDGGEDVGKERRT